MRTLTTLPPGNSSPWALPAPSVAMRDATAGSAYLVFGKANSVFAALDLTTMTARQGVHLTAPAAEHYAGPAELAAVPSQVVRLSWVIKPA